MITKAEKKRLKFFLGGHYVSVVKEELNLIGVFNKYGKKHSSTMIINVMNGKPHKIIEEAIYKSVKKIIQQEARKNILTKKSATTTTDS